MMPPRRLLLLAGMLLCTALACYSDNSLGLFRLTATPPLPTHIPAADSSQSALQPGDVALAVSASRLPLDLINRPEALRADLSNRAPQSCGHNTPVQVLYSGVAEDSSIYHLVDCNGIVGWASARDLLGPLPLLEGQRALTTEAGLNETGQFKIEANDPPYSEGAFRQQFDCRLADTVDVIDITGFVTGELYYKIRCQNPMNPIAPSVGWTVPEALFGPVRFRNGEQGIVPQEVAEVLLRESPNADATAGRCQQGELVQITEAPVQRLEDELYYEVSCTEGSGWANQDNFLGPVYYPAGTRVMVAAPPTATLPPDAASAEVPPSDAPLAEATGTPATAEAPSPAPAQALEVPLTDAPEPFTAENQLGLCPDAALVNVEALAGVAEQLYAQVSCGDSVGWLNSDLLYGPARFALGESVLLDESAILGFNQQGIYLSVNVFDIQGPSGGSSVIAGECAFDSNSGEPVPARLEDASYYRDSMGEIVGIFYLATCTGIDGEPVTGWINQSRIGEQDHG